MRNICIAGATAALLILPGSHASHHPLDLEAMAYEPLTGLVAGDDLAGIVHADAASPDAFA